MKGVNFVPKDVQRIVSSHKIKKLFLKISQYSQESNCVGVFFLNKNAGIQACNFIKKSLRHSCFLDNIQEKFWRTSENHYLWEFFLLC